MPTSSFILLSGEESTLPLAEAKALLEIYSSDISANLMGRRLLIIEGELNVGRVVQRGAYIRQGGTLLGIVAVESLEREIEHIDFKSELKGSKSFAVRALGMGASGGEAELERTVGGVVRRQIPAIKVSLDASERLVLAIRVAEHVFIGISHRLHTDRKWGSRRARMRPFFHPSTLQPKFARCLVNLTRARDGGIILDPFCGAGGILIEASLAGLLPIGGDISLRMCCGSKLNLSHFGLDFGEVLAMDASEFPLRRADALVTDVPYGKAASTAGKKVNELVENMLGEARDILNPSSCCCVVHPKGIEVSVEGFTMLEQHEVLVHSKLTRAITVLRRR